MTRNAVGRPWVACVLFAAVCALGCGGGGVKSQTDVLNDPFAFGYKRLEALKQLQKKGPLKPETQSIVAKSLSDSNPFIRKEAATTLRLAGGNAVMPTLQQALSVEVDNEVRREIGTAMEAVQPGSAAQENAEGVVQASTPPSATPTAENPPVETPAPDAPIPPTAVAAASGEKPEETPAVAGVQVPPPSLEENFAVRTEGSVAPATQTPAIAATGWPTVPPSPGPPEIQPPREAAPSATPTPVPTTPPTPTPKSEITGTATDTSTKSTAAAGDLSASMGIVLQNLRSDNADTRTEAAIFIRLMGDTADLPALKSALENETDPNARSEITKAIAALSEKASGQNGSLQGKEESTPVKAHTGDNEGPSTSGPGPTPTASGSASEVFPPFAWPTPQATPEGGRNSASPASQAVRTVQGNDSQKIMAWPTPTPPPSPSPSPTPGKPGVSLVAPAIKPAQIKPGGTARLEISYEIRGMAPGEKGDVREERMILYGGKVVRQFEANFSRENGRYVTEDTLSVPDGALAGSYVYRARVRHGEGSMEAEAPFSVAP